MSQSISTQQPLIIAHRGESYYEPENTLSAISLALDNRADGVEIDVHLTKDNEIAVIHDRNTRRVTGRNYPVRSLTVETMKKLDIKNNFRKENPCQKIPTLNEVMAIIPRNKYLFIEIKCGTEILPKLRSVLHRSNKNSEYVKLIGFDINTMSAAKNFLTDYEVFLNKRLHIERLISPKLMWNRLISRIKKASLNGLNLAYNNLINFKSVNLFKSNDLKLFVWTINNQKAAMKLIKMNVDGYLSDRSGFIRQSVYGVS